MGGDPVDERSRLMQAAESSSAQQQHRQQQQRGGGGSSSGGAGHYATMAGHSSWGDGPAAGRVVAGGVEGEPSASPTPRPTPPTRRSSSASARAIRAWRSLAHRIDSFFLITERDSSFATEIRAGTVTFVTMAYIVVVNAQILSKSGPDSSGEWMQFDSIVLATALSAALGSALVGLAGNLPFALAPGMGLNSYFTYGVCLRLGLTWRVALTCCFVQGLLFVLLAALGLCDLLQHHAPACIKKGITVGLGLFQALIGFELMQLVVPGRDVLLALGDLADARIWVALAGMMLIGVLQVWRIKGAMLVGMVAITTAAWALDPDTIPRGLAAIPQLQAHPLSMLDFPAYWAAAQQSVLVTLVMLFVSVFDTAGVQYMCGVGAGLIDENDQMPGSRAAFMAAGAATAVGACMGTSPVIIHNETFAGISDGARTGLHSVVVAVLFLLCVPFVPVLRAVPAIATSAPLVIVGCHMMFACKAIKWEEPHEAMPAFLCAAVLPLTYSIANGMLFGLGCYAVLKAAHVVAVRWDPAHFDGPAPIDIATAAVVGQHQPGCAQAEPCSCILSPGARSLPPTPLPYERRVSDRSHRGAQSLHSPVPPYEHARFIGEGHARGEADLLCHSPTSSQVILTPTRASSGPAAASRSGRSPPRPAATQGSRESLV